MIFKFINILNTLVIWPPFEYFLHYYLHYFNNDKHKDHHIFVHKKNFENFTSFSELEYFYYIVPILFILDYPILFWGSSWYYSVHTIIHYKPELLPILSKHHHCHHKYPTYNFGVTTTYYDYIFGTKK